MALQAHEIVSLIRLQNWKNGGALKVGHDDAVAVVLQAMKTAYSKGLVDAAQHTSKMMMQAFEATSDR